MPPKRNRGVGLPTPAPKKSTLKNPIPVVSHEWTQRAQAMCGTAKSCSAPGLDAISTYKIYRGYNGALQWDGVGDDPFIIFEVQEDAALRWDDGEVHQLLDRILSTKVKAFMLVFPDTVKAKMVSHIGGLPRKIGPETIYWTRREDKWGFPCSTQKEAGQGYVDPLRRNDGELDNGVDLDLTLPLYSLYGRGGEMYSWMTEVIGLTTPTIYTSKAGLLPIPLMPTPLLVGQASPTYVPPTWEDLPGLSEDEKSLYTDTLDHCMFRGLMDDLGINPADLLQEASEASGYVDIFNNTLKQVHGQPWDSGREMLHGYLPGQSGQDGDIHHYKLPHLLAYATALLERLKESLRANGLSVDADDMEISSMGYVATSYAKLQLHHRDMEMEWPHLAWSSFSPLQVKPLPWLFIVMFICAVYSMQF